MKSARIYYSGKIQGVGFRYNTLQMARACGLTGVVRNLEDGRVEIRCEGSQEQIDNLCRALERHFEGTIQDKDISVSDDLEGFSDFQIVY